MANPAPTINQINAFDVTQGTTIDFNIIGGTEVIRSNKIYIYDLSDNSLICTHLYVSTELIHELPQSTDASIVYESGKSSADFVNNKQYYMQIQTFTNTSGTQGGSGLSVAKLFWCLPTPTLTINSIPSTITTTSYNVSAVYNSNTTAGVSNDVQQFQFNLYSATNVLLQTSDVIVMGEGVSLSYNFSGLSIGDSYYVTLNVTTTQGMNVSAQSNTFTVSIVTPTLGSATVTNNACSGYISVISNLSSSYTEDITKIIVKRKDVNDVSGTWLSLYEKSITQASDMNFTFIDFLNIYGKTYQYALVPVLTQNQGGIVVEIEGGYTVSQSVDSVFDGVFIADQTGIEKVKAGAGYGNIDMNQSVGSILPIGAKYPVVVTNSSNQYHNGSLNGRIVPNDYYFNGNLSRIDIVNKRNEIEQFLTNKRAKIIKDWNGNMWLVMIMDNISCSYDDNYGMGMISFSANWIEVGDPNNQEDLQATGLINVGGV